ncbi:hypothetical protein HMPREF9715_01493, partial [Myroides odoratimimus CIP 101113]
MKRNLLNLAMIFLAGNSYAQLGIGVTKPNNSSQLEVSANDKGVLLPRVALKSIVDQSTIVKGNVNSLLVFNTSISKELAPGYYYWFKDRWVRILNSSDLDDIVRGIKYDLDLVIDGDSLKMYDKNGSFVSSVPIKDLNTLTSLVNNNDGTYTYTNESGITSI